MSQNVQLLKQLLFEPETQALADVAQRIEAVAALDERGREVLRRQIDDILSRVGDGEKLSRSVSDILSDALRRAEVSNHDELSRAVAPLVVATIKTELRNSQDEMVEALYPITGRLVKSYVASAVKDLTAQINRRLEQNPVMLRLTSIATGRSVAELALAGTQDFRVLELFLIRRGTGALIARWPESAASGREHAVSGILAAINEFANDAFSGDQSSLRQIDLGGEEVYLRASPLYLLAARCSGQAPDTIEQLLDETFLDAVDRQHLATAGSDTSERVAARVQVTIAELGKSLTQQIEDLSAQHQHRAGFGLLKALAALILLPIIGWYAFSTYSAWAEARVRDSARSVVNSIAAMNGYPVELEVSPRGRVLVVSGLAPSPDAKSDVREQLTEALPSTRVVDHISVVPGSGPKPRDFTQDVAKVQSDVTRLERGVVIAAARRACEGAIISLQKAGSDLSRVTASMPADAAAVFRQAIEATAATTAAVTKARARLREDSDAGTAIDVAREMARYAAQIDATSNSLLDMSLPAAAAAEAAVEADAGDPPIGFAAQSLTAAADRLQAIAGAAVFTVLQKPEPAPAAPPAPGPSAEERLRAWSASNAIFFANDVDYRAADSAKAVLQELAALAADTRNLIRIVGYTDETGGQARNVPLAQSRADKVLEDLVALGVAPERLVAIGRAGAVDLSKSQGATSPNRRVEFEIGFNGEIAQ